jgi:toxin HigB-1
VGLWRALDFSFHTEEIRDVCETRAKALAMLGLNPGIELHRRLADVQATSNVAEYLELFPAALVDRSAHERAILFAEGHSLVFKSGHVQTPMTPNGTTDWTKVSRIYLIAVETAP